MTESGTATPAVTQARREAPEAVAVPPVHETAPAQRTVADPREEARDDAPTGGPDESRGDAPTGGDESRGDGPDEAPAEVAKVAEDRTARLRPAVQDGTGFLCALGLAWLGARLWSAHANIHDAVDGLSRIIVAAYQLPDVIAASTLAGATCGVASAAWLRARHPATTVRRRWLVGALAGLLTGVLAGAVVVLGYGSRSPDLVLALSVLVACAVGGALAAATPSEVAAAGLAATLAAFVVGVVLNVFSSGIVDLFGPGTTAASHLAAANRAEFAESLVEGLVAGLVAFLYLRRGTGERRFLAYLAAGATPGILIVIAEVMTRIGGAQLFDLARKLSPADNTAVDYFGWARVNHALIVLFTAAIVALVAFGRTLPRRAPRGGQR